VNQEQKENEKEITEHKEREFVVTCISPY